MLPLTQDCCPPGILITAAHFLALAFTCSSDCTPEHEIKSYLGIRIRRQIDSGGNPLGFISCSLGLPLLGKVFETGNEEDMVLRGHKMQHSLHFCFGNMQPEAAFCAPLHGAHPLGNTRKFPLPKILAQGMSVSLPPRTSCSQRTSMRDAIQEYQIWNITWSTNNKRYWTPLSHLQKLLHKIKAQMLKYNLPNKYDAVIRDVLHIQASYCTTFWLCSDNSLLL